MKEDKFNNCCHGD